MYDNRLDLQDFLKGSRAQILKISSKRREKLESDVREKASISRLVGTYICVSMGVLWVYLSIYVCLYECIMSVFVYMTILKISSKRREKLESDVWEKAYIARLVHTLYILTIY